MSTSTARQPKGVPVGGQFAATTHAEQGIVLNGGRAEFVTDTHLYEREMAALVGPDAVIEEENPQNRSESTRLLKNSRGEADGKIRKVRLHSDNSPNTEPGEKVEVVGPKDGRPIIVDRCRSLSCAFVPPSILLVVEAMSSPAYSPPRYVKSVPVWPREDQRRA